MDRQYIYNDIFLRRFINKFYFCNVTDFPQLNNISFEFNNTSSNMHLMMVSFMDELVGSLPFFLKKGFNYSFDGKKIFIKDLRLVSNDDLLSILKILYVLLPRRRIRSKLIKSIGSSSAVLTVLCSDFIIPFYRELFLLIDTINLNLNFNVNNRFLFSYFLKNFNFF